ncbi:HrpE/YscL family type III secretion apparatus protein [Candidatus Neptunichlamydia sp. REUL1]|uniref:HrpE/YscL family type III secretion apparatus protein n=1 Tax=Candidatus Neptunichlamydia sp. REUL1 TaxID=3064277 RepID=UPI002931B34F|nr:HrpE/YscL family type III secretion apparatus protein [Candidatus Neptunochlamydia sp. REUL1]
MSKYFSLIYSGEITQGSDDKVIPSDEFSELLKATDVLNKAKADVKTYLENNKEECQKLLAKAEEAGFNKGLSEFNKQILYYQERVKQLEHELQKTILPLALKAAKKIVGRELELKPETIVDIVRQTLKPVTQNHHIKIFVAKQDKEALEERKKELRDILEHVQTFIIEEREDITPGGCIIETEAGIINASLENQWRALESAFETFMKRK